MPQLFELVGIAFSSWFIYRYLLFKPDRCVRVCSDHNASAVLDTRPCAPPRSEELKRTLEELKNKILA